MIRKSEGVGGGTTGPDEETSFERDETQLMNQDSDPTPTGLNIFGKKRSTNVVAPYNEPMNDSKFDLSKKLSKPAIGSRYNIKAGGDNLLDDDLVDESKDFNFDDQGEFSRDGSGDEDIGIGKADDDDDFDNIGIKGGLFDNEDLYGNKHDRKKLKSNRSKMLLDELDGDMHETDQSMRQPTMQDDETGALNSNRAMVPLETKKSKGSNPLTRSQALPNSSTKDGSLKES